MNYFINIRDFIYYNRKYFIVAIILIILITFYIFNTSNKQEEVMPVLEIKETTEEVPKDNTLFIDIKGEVVNPGLYEIDKEKRVMDVITLAGGLLEDADTSNINLSMKVIDEMVIIIPKKEENNINNNYVINNDAEIKKSNKSSSSSNGKVSINNASVEELMTISGIGEVKARKIVEYRNTQGRFSSIDELANVSGIGAKTVEKIKDYITL